MSRVIRGGSEPGAEPGAAGAPRVVRSAAEPAAGPRVVPAEVYDARGEAARILAEAERDAEAIRAHAEHEANRVREDARRAGADAGRAEVAALLLRAAGARDAALAGAERELMALAIAAAKRIVGEELAVAPDRIGAIVGAVLARARRARALHVRVHPDDVAALQRLHQGASAGIARAPIEIEGDAAISRGGCVVATDLGELDARLEVQLDALARALGCDPP